MSNSELSSRKGGTISSHLLGELTKDQTELIKAFALVLMIFSHVVWENLTGYNLMIFGKDIKPYLYLV